MRLPFLQALPKIGFEAGGGLVALLGALGEELHDDGRQRWGDRGAIARRCWLARYVAVDPLQGVGGGKRQLARKHLVQGDSKRVEIAASINRAIHAAGLFGRHVGKGSGNNLWRYRRLALARHLGRNPEAGEPHLAGVVDQHIRRLDVLMQEAATMDLGDCCRQSNGNTQQASQPGWLSPAPLKNLIQWLAARILEYE